MEIKKYPLLPDPRPLTPIASTDSVYVTIFIGNGQGGASKISWNEKVLVEDDITQPVLLGQAGELAANPITALTRVVHQNSFTKSCVITTTFTNQNNKVLFQKEDTGETPQNGVASFKGHYLIQLLSMWLIFIFCCYTTAFTQENSDTLNERKKSLFEDLETPSSPGLILLDQAPSSIEKPTTPQGLGLGLLGLQKNGGALEFAPYWLKIHPELTPRMMYTNKTPFKYNFSVSIACVKSDSAGNYYSGGIRTRIVSIYAPKITQKLDSLNEAIKRAALAIDEDDPENPENKKLEKLQKEFMQTTALPVFTIDVAAAIGAGSPTNSFRDLALNRWAAWFSLNFRPKGDDFYFTFLGRYLGNEKFGGYSTRAEMIDLGARFNYDLKRVSLSMEYLQRLNMTSGQYDDYRVAVIGSFEIMDDIYITSTFGKNFTDINNIIALAGVNFGYSRKKSKAWK